jgi:DUF4097 and DUF4098 domain-containing protein YvlB
MKRYLDDLQKELEKKNLRRDEIDDILSDHREMIASALEEGLSEDDIVKTFGEPSKVADDLAAEPQEDKADTSAKTEVSEIIDQEITVDSIEIDIDLVNDDVTFGPGEDDRIKVSAKGIKSISKYTVTFEGDVLRIKAPKISGIIFLARRQSGSFDIRIPKNVTVRRVCQHGVNSDVNMVSLKTGSMDLNTTNGDVSIKDSALGFTTMNSVNGKITLDHITAKELKMSQVSGDTEIKDSTITNALKMNTVSGDIKLETVKADITHFHSVSGDVNGVEFYPEALNFNSISGDLQLSNQAEHTITRLKTHTLSGTIRT